MATAGGIRLGKVFVEIGADPSKLFGALNKLNKRIGSIGSSMANFGGRMTALGVGLAAPLAIATRTGARFDSTLRNISASTGATAQDISRIDKAAMGMSQAMGIGPTAIAEGFLELLKAGMPLEDVLGGAGKAALQFAKVGELAVADAAVVMSDAMNVFGVDASKAANTLSSAADASSTSIEEISQAFTQVSAVASQSNQGIDDVAAALALLANAGVKGSDAGTSLKNMFAKLKSPVDAAATALGEVGLSTDSFRDASGAMLPLADQITVLKNATDGLSEASRDSLFQKVFGTDAIRAALILTSTGAAGINGMKNTMNESLPVGEKFEQLMGGLAGTGEKISASLERLQITLSAALAPTLGRIGNVITGVVNGFSEFAANNTDTMLAVGEAVLKFTLLGGALYGVGKALMLVSGGLGLVMSPLGLFVAGIGGIAVASGFAQGAMDDLTATAESTGDKISDALASGDFSAAWIYAIAAVEEALLRMRATFDRTIQKPINLTAVKMAGESRFSEIMDQINPGQKAWQFGAGEDVKRRARVAKQLDNATNQEQFVAASDLANQEIAMAEQAGNGQIAAGFRELIQMTKEQLIQVGAMGDGSLERGLEEIRTRAESKIADLERRRAEKQAQEALAPAAGGAAAVAAKMGPQGPAAPAGGLADTPRWLQGMIDQERSSLAAKAEAERIAAETRMAIASSSEAVGTFSGVGLGGLGFGNALQEKQVGLLEKIEANTRENGMGAVLA